MDWRCLVDEILSGPNVTSLCGGLCALLPGALGILLIIIYFRNKQKTKESRNWLIATGKVIRSEISMVMNDEDSSKVSFIPRLEYEYKVGDTLYKSKRISFGSAHDFSSRQKAEEFIGQFPVDSQVTIYYDPNKPKDAVLIREMRSMKAGLIVGILLIVGSVLVFCISLTGLIKPWSWFQ